MKAKRFIFIFFLTLSIGLGGSFLYWLNFVKPSTEVTTQGSNDRDVCEEFRDVDHEISCEEVVAMALRNTPGTAQKVSIGPIWGPNPSAALPEELRENVWLVDIEVLTPYFDTAFQREIKFLRIGIGLNEAKSVRKKPLDILK